MLEIKDKKECTGCSACFNICPAKAITMKEDEEGFIYPKIDETKCIKCGLCEKTCPCVGEYKNTNLDKPTVLASWSLDNENKLQSSSGGCFYEIAKYVIAQDGVVFGAAFDNELNVIHKLVDNIEGLVELKGSKYVQSKIGDCYVEAKKCLEEGRLVLFVGTPCQVAGLYSYLKNKQYDNLYTADLICHGVPSGKVYRKYLKEQEQRNNSKPISLTFRDKSNGWKKYKVKIKFENGEYIKSASEDIYMRAFLSDICLRPSCYSCKFSKLPRVADITLGDFWGIDGIKPKLDDDTGTSELVINSNKGEELFAKVKENVFFEEMQLEDGIKFNPSLVSSVRIPKKREAFFRDVDRYTLNKLSKKYFPSDNLTSKVVRKLKSIIKKMKLNK